MRKISYGAMLLTTCGAMAFAAPALAQTTASSDSDEVVVTASRREERLQDVPIAVTAIGADQIANTAIKNLTDIQYVSAGVEFGTTPNDSGFRIRGAGTAGGFTSSSEQSVGLVVDDVVIPFGNPVQSLGDVSRIEVLQGPQGTQFGKNASSGVISVTSARPRMDAFSGHAFASYAELNERDVNLGLNVPMSDNAAFNVFLFNRATDGFVDNVVRHEEWGGQENSGVRGQFLWNVTPNFSALVIGDFAVQSGDGPGQLWTLNKISPLGEPGFIPFLGGTDLNALGVTPGPDNEKSVEEFQGNTGEIDYGLSTQLNWSLGDYTLSSVTAWRGQDGDELFFAIDGTSLPRFTAHNSGARNSFYSQEFRLTSPSEGMLEYVTGLYFSRLEASNGDGDSATLRPALPFSSFPFISITNGFNKTDTVTNSAAIFADGRLRFSDQFSLLFGARYTKDDVDASNSASVDPDLPPFPGILGNTGRPVDKASTSGSGWSGRFGFEFKPSDNILLFATAARGYLGPTVTFSALTATRSDVDPQTVDDITVGAKTQFFDRRLTLNGTVFYDDYTDLQTSVFDGVEFLSGNAGGFRTKGAQVEARFRASNNLTLTGSYAYTDAYYTDYIVACPTPFVVAGTQTTSCNAPGSVPGHELFQAGGQHLPNSPMNTFTLGFNYQHPVSASLVLDASANYYYRGHTRFEVGNPDTNMPSYELVNTNVGIGPEDGNWRLGVFARNLFDEHFVAGIIGLPFTTNPGSYVNWNTREGRRTVGISLETRF